MLSQLNLGAGIADVVAALHSMRVVTFMALSDLRARYKRSVLGPFWLTLSTAAGSAGLGFIWSELMHMDAHSFVPSLTAGLILWQLISQLILESTTLFGRQAGIIRNLNLPLSIHPLQLMLRHVINFAHNIPVFFIVALLLGQSFGLVTFLALPCLLLLCANLFWIVMLVSILGARYRDIEYLLASIMPLLMFVSPVFYRPNYLPFNQTVMWFNPFSHLIEIVRYPLLGSAPPAFVVEVNLAMLVIGTTVTLVLFNQKRSRIPFWV
jgi:ABC-type polysaccharide/polyol phosphate export permease